MSFNGKRFAHSPTVDLNEIGHVDTLILEEFDSFFIAIADIHAGETDGKN